MKLNIFKLNLINFSFKEMKGPKDEAKEMDEILKAYDDNAKP